MALNFPEKSKVFPAKKLGQFSAQRAPLGLVTSAQRVPAQTKKKKKLGQFSAHFKFREVLPFGTECGKTCFNLQEEVNFLN
jgi:hypothetical protein